MVVVSVVVVPVVLPAAVAPVVAPEPGVDGGGGSGVSMECVMVPPRLASWSVQALPRSRSPTHLRRRPSEANVQVGNGFGLPARGGRIAVLDRRARRRRPAERRRVAVRPWDPGSRGARPVVLTASWWRRVADGPIPAGGSAKRPRPPSGRPRRVLFRLR